MQIIKKILIYSLTGLVIQSCVPAKQFESLQDTNDKCEEEREILKEENRQLSIDHKELKAKYESVLGKVDGLVEDSIQKKSRVLELEMDYDRLLRNYNSLQEVQENLLAGNIQETKELLQEIQNTQGSLMSQEDRLKELQSNLRLEQKNLEQIKSELEERNARLVELESILYRKDSVVNALKEKVTNALLGFSNQGLDVYQKNGKVYVSLDEKLLFQSGSTNVDPKGVSALKKLSEVLASNPDINIMVEGHTDDVPYISSDAIKDNWDLSVKRATAIVRILLENKNIKGSRIIAAGRSKYQPVENAKTKEARRKNRRTEIILTPKLDELFRILESN